MLSFLSPGYLLAAFAAAAGLVAAHFIVRRQPRAMLLPTARFVPDAPVLTTGWARLPADPLPLALRVLCVLLAGIALAGPFLPGRAGGSARVILADQSRAVADTAEVRDSVAAVREPGDVVIRYGSSASEEVLVGSPGLAGMPDAQAPASLSAGLVAATRAASRFHNRADSVELVIVSSFAAEEVDAATARVRQEWPGRARLVRVAVPTAADSARSPALSSEPGDPFAVALGIARPLTRADVRVVRGALSGADSTWTAAGRGRVLVHWPAIAAPAGFTARTDAAPIAGLIARGPALLAMFQRRWQYVPALGNNPVAWWIDGEVAAAERALGGGCVRSVAVPVSAGGDFVLRPDFHSVLRELVQPCGGMTAYHPMPEAALAMLGGTGRLALAGAFAQPRTDVSPIAKWLLIASLGCALLELVVRRRARTKTADARAGEGGLPARKAA